MRGPNGTPVSAVTWFRPQRLANQARGPFVPDTSAGGDHRFQFLALFGVQGQTCLRSSQWHGRLHCPRKVPASARAGHGVP
jgi:hypothetical protein